MVHRTCDSDILIANHHMMHYSYLQVNSEKIMLRKQLYRKTNLINRKIGKNYSHGEMLHVNRKGYITSNYMRYFLLSLPPLPLEGIVLDNKIL